MRTPGLLARRMRLTRRGRLRRRHVGWLAGLLDAEAADDAGWQLRVWRCCVAVDVYRATSLSAQRSILSRAIRTLKNPLRRESAVPYTDTKVMGRKVGWVRRLLTTGRARA